MKSLLISQMISSSRCSKQDSSGPLLKSGIIWSSEMKSAISNELAISHLITDILINLIYKLLQIWFKFKSRVTKTEEMIVLISEMIGHDD